MTNFSKVVERDKLKPRRDPYWTKMSKGCYLGYRKMTVGSAGSWTTRYLDESNGKQVYKPLGDFSDLPDHQRYDSARTEAQKWFNHVGIGGSTEVVTITDVCSKYLIHLRETKGHEAADNAQERLSRHVLSDKRFAEIELAKLTPLQVGTWRKVLRDKPAGRGPNCGKIRSDSSLNREMTAFRAALNFAYNEQLVTSDFAWRSKLKPVKDADRRRDVYLDLEQRRKLVSCAPEHLADFIRGLCLIPLRPGALAALTVASYDERLKTLTVGKDKAGQDRKITFPDATAAFFAGHCKNKLPGTPLLQQVNGKAWHRVAWLMPFKKAAALAGLPVKATSYAIRHSTITDLIHGGLDALTVAQLAGTSVLMIQKHYGHLTQQHSRDALAKLTL